MSNALNLTATFYAVQNTTVTMAELGVFNCPSDPGVGTIYYSSLQPAGRSKGNYAVNWGNCHYDQGSPNPFNGPLGSVVPIKGPFTVYNTSKPNPIGLRDITDGTSNTMLVGELKIGLNTGTGTSQSDVRGDIWSDSRCANDFTAYLPPDSPLPDSLNATNDCQIVTGNAPCVYSGSAGVDYGAGAELPRGGRQRGVLRRERQIHEGFDQHLYLAGDQYQGCR